MADAEFRVTNPHAPRQAVDLDIKRKAEDLRDEAARLTPRLTGRLAESWKVTKEKDADYEVSTDVPYARFVEYGTSHMHGAAMLGRAAARERA